MIGNLFAISAGLLLFVATGPLMSPLKSQPPIRSLLALGTGIGIALALSLSPFGHRHTHSPGHGSDSYQAEKSVITRHL